MAGNENGVPIEATPTIEVSASVEMGGASSESNAEAWAVGERHGVPVNRTDQTYHNNSKYYAEQAAESAEALEEAQEIIDGYEADSEAYATGKRDGTDVGSDDPTYHNNSKYYAEQASGSATAAAGSATAAAGSAEDAEAWAVGKRGGTDVPSTDDTYHNNAKYYAEQAAQAAQQGNADALYAALKAIGIVVYNDAFYIDPDAMPAAT